jgi:hypothetical protein
MKSDSLFNVHFRSGTDNEEHTELQKILEEVKQLEEEAIRVKADAKDEVSRKKEAAMRKDAQGKDIRISALESYTKKKGKITPLQQLR